MRVPSALVSAFAYALGRDTAPIAPAEATVILPRAVVEPWRPSGIPDEPDPVAEFMFCGLKADTRARTPIGEVLDAYASWARLRGLPEPDRGHVLERICAYGTIQSGDGVVSLRGFALWGPGAFAVAARTTSLRAIPALRARVLADSALLAAELLAVVQSTRSVLEAATDEPGPVGDVVRLAAAMLDDAMADAACASP